MARFDDKANVFSAKTIGDYPGEYDTELLGAGERRRSGNRLVEATLLQSNNQSLDSAGSFFGTLAFQPPDGGQSRFVDCL